MASGTDKLSLPDRLLAEIEKAAQAQERPVNELLAEAVEAYLQEKKWARLQSYGRNKARERGLTEDDVDPLIQASRRDRSL